MNFINGELREGSAGWIDVESPATGARVAQVTASSTADIDAAVAAAAKAFPAWSSLTVKRRAAVCPFHPLSHSFHHPCLCYRVFSSLCAMPSPHDSRPDHVQGARAV